MRESAGLKERIDRADGLRGAQARARAAGVGDATIQKTRKTDDNLRNELRTIKCKKDYVDD